jgi:hypothetical protein
MTENAKLTKITLKALVDNPDGQISYEREHREAPEVVTIRFDSADFEMTRHYDTEASHAEPEMGLVEVLRRAAEHFAQMPDDEGHEFVIEPARGSFSIDVRPMMFAIILHSEADRLATDSQQRERDIAVGKAIRKRFYVEDTKAKPFDDIDLTLGIAAREALEANS